MTKFFVGQRVRIVVAEVWPELLGVETRIAGTYMRAESREGGVWYGFPLEVRSPRGQLVVAHPDRIEPILPSGHAPAEIDVHELLPFLKEGVSA